MTSTDELRKLYEKHRHDSDRSERHRARFTIAESVTSLLDELEIERTARELYRARCDQVRRELDELRSAARELETARRAMREIADVNDEATHRTALDRATAARDALVALLRVEDTTEDAT